MQHNTGGVVYGASIPAIIESDECILGRDMTCRRRDDVHRADLPADRFWVCPLNDGESK